MSSRLWIETSMEYFGSGWPCAMPQFEICIECLEGVRILR